MLNVFIDGSAGTTGLQLETRLRSRSDVKLLALDPALRKDPTARKAMLNTADVVFLCLPDDAAREAVSLVENPEVIIIDASTAHRTAPSWVYGLPELSQAHEEAIRASKRIAVPGCHASGFCAAVYPMIQSGLISKQTPITCFSLTGYSGGGKKMIADYEENRTPGDALTGTRPYALGLTHKHLPEMQTVCGLDTPPVFLPAVGDFAQGMLVSVLLPGVDAHAVHHALTCHYENAERIRVMPYPTEEAFLDPQALNGTNDLELFVLGHETQTVITARLDNLGKGASGAAVQLMEMVTG